jgi:hypothetical protein
LDAQEAVEGPFAVELEDGLQVGGFAGEAAGGGYVLAGVVAFGWAIPEEEAALEGCGWVLVGRWWVVGWGGGVRMLNPLLPQFASWQSYVQSINACVLQVS